MDGHALDVDELEALPAEQVVERRERVVAEVLVIDRVELAALDHVA